MFCYCLVLLELFCNSFGTILILLGTFGTLDTFGTPDALGALINLGTFGTVCTSGTLFF